MDLLKNSWRSTKCVCLHPWSSCGSWSSFILLLVCPTGHRELPKEFFSGSPDSLATQLFAPQPMLTSDSWFRLTSALWAMDLVFCLGVGSCSFWGGGICHVRSCFIFLVHVYHVKSFILKFFIIIVFPCVSCSCHFCFPVVPCVMFSLVHYLNYFQVPCLVISPYVYSPHVSIISCLALYIVTHCLRVQFMVHKSKSISPA